MKNKDNFTVIESPQSKKKKGSLKKRIITGVSLFLGFCFVLICCGIGIIYSYIYKINIVPDGQIDNIVSIVDDVDSSLENSPDDVISSIDDAINNNNGDVMSSKQVTNILLIGTDARSNTERGRSDSMILISINKKTGKLYLTSFMRDLYVKIPGLDQNNRINVAYARGGASLLLDTIRLNFKIAIDEYVQVDFNSFERLIDELGGIKITVTDGEATQIPGITTGGTYTLNGAQSLSYARIRHVGNADFQRTERQRLVLTTIMDECRSLSITQLKSLMDILLPNLTTNMSSSEIFGMVVSSPTYFGYPVTTQRVPSDGTFWSLNVRQMSVLGNDFQANINFLRNTIYDGVLN